VINRAEFAPSCPGLSRVIGVRGLLVRALLPEDKRFYEDNGFQESPASSMALLVALKDAMAALGVSRERSRHLPQAREGDSDLVSRPVLADSRSLCRFAPRHDGAFCADKPSIAY
jgi:hypothetical protein